MLHQDIKSLGPLEPKNQAKFHLSWEQSIKRVVCSNISTTSIVIEFKIEETKLLEKRNVEIRRATTKYNHSHKTFVEAFNKELATRLFKPMDVQELQDP